MIINHLIIHLSLSSMKNPVFRLVLILLIIFGSACNTKERKALLPRVTGKPGEVLLIIDEYQWESAFGEFFLHTFNKPFEVLPADEPVYDLIHIPSNAFSKLFKSHRNIILIKISEDHKEPRIIVQRNVWATPQLVINIIGPNNTSMLTYLEESREKLLDLLGVDERNRTIGNYRKNMAKGINERMKTKHQLSIIIPAGYEIGVDSSNFVWLTHEVADMMQGVFIYHYPYTDTNTFTPEYLIKQRDAFTRKYVPGPTKGSYMTTEPSFPLNVSENVKNGLYMVEIRGLWRTEKAFMGGPFVSHTFLDEKRNRIITAEGFVYAPSLDKRNYLRELEAIIQTVEIVD